MLFEEAKWVGDHLGTVLTAEQVILNLGSSTQYARTVLQPHMTDFIFEPLQVKGIRVIHSDLSDDEGIDLQGDFTDPNFIDELKRRHFDGVMCCNLFEHLTDRQPLIDCLNEIVPPDGYLLITVPRQYPYHLDPIDTMYRPRPEELTALFPHFEVVQADIVEARRQVNKNGKIVYHKNYFEQLREDPKLFLRLMAKSLLPFYKFSSWKITTNDLLRMFRPFSVTCILLKRASDSAE
jgi:SAM-dependent methyltransferase